MGFSSVTILLIVGLLNVEANSIFEQPKLCDGGYCVPKHYCPTGKSGDVPNRGQNGLITVRVGEEDECGDFMMVCCKNSTRNLRQTDYKCGMSNPQGMVYYLESKLEYAKYAEFPWTVAIYKKVVSILDPYLITNVGGGTLIHPKFVLTAAHTLKKPHQYVARFGEWNMFSEAQVYPTQDIDIEEVIRHPSYLLTTTPHNDIALALLQESVIYSEHIRPLCLPNAQDVFYGQRCIATGWGVDVRTRKSPPVMKRMELEVISRMECQALYQFGGAGGNFRLHRSVVCANAVQDQASCMYDGGSPLACQKADGSYVLAGITSWGVECGQLDLPGVYVDVTKFTSWINDKIDQYDEEERMPKRLELMPFY